MSLQIVCLDGYTLNPGDISWDGFKALGQFTTHDRTADKDVPARAAGAAALLTNKVALSAETIAKLPALKYIGVLATGYNVVDVKAAAGRSIVVTNVPAYGTESVAQHATALMLELARRVAVHSQAVRAGQWSKSIDWCFALEPVVELNGRTLAIIGLGRIGLALAKIAAAMGMKIIACNAHPSTAQPLGGVAVEYVSMDDAFARADVVSLHCPLTPDTKNLVNATRLAKMKKTAFLLNTSRGPLVDNAALADALNRGVIAGAGLDVLDVEPPPADNPLIGAKNCVITPHLAWYARESRARLMGIAVENLKAFQAGHPVNVVK